MIEVKNLHHHYGVFHAIKGVSFKMPAGKITGLIGQNGAGKSTLLKTLAGYLVPTEGDILVDDVSYYQDPIATRRKIGYMPETPLLYKDMKVDEYLVYVGKLKQLPKTELKNQKEFLIEKCGLIPMRHKLIGNLSKGNRQRVAMAQALMAKPKILLLDEPTSALDPKQVIEIRKLIESLRADGASIMMSSHILSEVAQVCDHLVYIRGGSKYYEGATGQVNEKAHNANLACVVKLRFREFQKSWLPILQKLPAHQLIALEEGLLTLNVQDADAFYPAFLQTVTQHQWPLREILQDKHDLERLFD